MKKIVYVVLDGLGDLPIESLGNKTPLESANTPNMDMLARKGVTGRMYTVGKGIAPQSDIAVISILGYDPNTYYTGRGPLESFASGLKVNDGDLALRVNFATVDSDWNIVDRRVGRNLSTEEARELAAAVNAEVKLTSSPATFEFLSTIGHRGCLVIRSEIGPLCGEISNTDPAYDKIGPLGVAKAEFDPVVQKSKPVQGYEDNRCAIRAAELLNEFTRKSYEVLEKHPVNKRRRAEGKMPGNMILCRDAGDKLPAFPPFKERFGLNFASFVEMPVEEGIAKLMGIDIVELPLPSGNLSKDYIERAELAAQRIADYDGLYIHIKGPDEPAHDGDYELKKSIIEVIDEDFFGNLLPKLDMTKVIVTVTADHSTPCEHKSHSDDPVPIVVSGGNIVSDGSSAFSETVAQNGSLGLLDNGTEFMPLLIELAKK